MTANQHFNHVCDKVWYFLQAADEYCITLRETTLTDLILLWLHEHKASFRSMHTMIIQKISQDQEPDQGIDWEWWIGNQGRGWWRYAVQAKKLSQKKNSIRYDSLRHVVGRSRPQQLQHEVLERYAQKNRAMPIYAFYNYVWKDDYRPYWHCKSCLDKSKLGITITPLKNVKWAISNRGMRTFDRLHEFPKTIPLRCLTCPNLRCPTRPDGERKLGRNDWGVYFDADAWHPNRPAIFGESVELCRDSLPKKFYKGCPDDYPKIILILETNES